MKAGIVLLVFCVFLIFISFQASAYFTGLSCSIKGSCSEDEVNLFQMSSTNNSHASADDSYPEKVCCGGIPNIGKECSGNYDIVMRLFDLTNSHVEAKQVDSGYYAIDVCLSSLYTVDCESYVGNCSGLGDYECVASISGLGNAHVGNCSAYNRKICCYIPLEGFPEAAITINDNDTYALTRDVTLNLSFSDNETGISECGFSNDDINYIWEPCLEIPPSSRDLSEALDINLSFTTGGTADWFNQTTTFFYDGDAAESGDITDNQESWIQTTVIGPTTVSFYWKVSSEGGATFGDYLEFYIDSSLQDSICGSVDWNQMMYTLDSGSHTLVWRYVKDGSASAGSDASWVDRIEINNLDFGERIKNWTLSPGDGVKTVYFQVKNNAGNTRKVFDTIILDTSEPIVWIDPPLPEWVGPEYEKWAGSQDGSVKAFNVSWKAQNVLGVDCYQVQYNTSAIPWTNWTIEGTDCTNRTEWTLGPTEPIQLQNGETYSFRVRVLNKVGKLGDWSPENHTSVNAEKPEVIITVTDQDGSPISLSGGDGIEELLEGGIVSFSGDNALEGGTVSYQGGIESINIAVVAQSISGIKENYIYICIISEGSEECRYEYGPSTGPEVPSSFSMTIPFDNNMIVKFRVTARDYADNANMLPNSYGFYYITGNYGIANFIAHYLEISLGDSAFLRVRVRNLQDSPDNVTLNLSVYSFATFVDAENLDLGVNKRTAWVGLNPYEEKELIVKVLSSSIGQFFIYLNATSSLTEDGDLCGGTGCVEASDIAVLTTGYAPEFPGLNIWAVLLLVVISLIVYSVAGKADKNIPI